MAPPHDPDTLAVLYRELRRIASGYLSGQAAAQTLQPTAIVHEAWLRLAGNSELQWRDQSHFMAISAKAMRNVLLDHLRANRAQKRGGGALRVTLSGIDAGEGGSEIDVLALGDALEKLAELDPRQAEIVELRFFGGLSVAETAAQLGIGERTVKADWRMAKAWLRARLRPDTQS